MSIEAVTLKDDDTESSENKAIYLHVPTGNQGIFEGPDPLAEVNIKVDTTDFHEPPPEAESTNSSYTNPDHAFDFHTDILPSLPTLCDVYNFIAAMQVLYSVVVKSDKVIRERIKKYAEDAKNVIELLEKANDDTTDEAFLKEMSAKTFELLEAMATDTYGRPIKLKMNTRHGTLKRFKNKREENSNLLAPMNYTEHNPYRFSNKLKDTDEEDV